MARVAPRGGCTERLYGRKEVRPLEQTRAHSIQGIKVGKYITTFFHSVYCEQEVWTDRKEQASNAHNQIHSIGDGTDQMQNSITTVQ